MQPAQIQPIYLPAWFVDAELQANAWLSPHNSESEDAQQQPVNAYFSQSYLPGYSLDLLGRLAFINKNMDPRQTVPFSETLTRQSSDNVMCLPFTITPLSLPEQVRKLSFTQATVCDGFRFHPASVKPNLLAAYPVLIPIYLMRYPLATPSTYMTVILEAYSKPGRFFAQETAASTEDPSSPDLITHGGKPSLFAQLKLIPRGDTVAAGALENWLSATLFEPGMTEILASDDPINMDDPRVREWTRDEVLPVQDWLNLGAEIAGLKDTLKKIPIDESSSERTFQISWRSSSQVARQAPKSPPDSTSFGPLKVERMAGGDFVRSLKNTLKKLERRRNDLTPEWWKQWSTGNAGQG
ncbi:hypothetical protein SERLADRAFT_438355 [Serpula lacrymans var. lacrymans S7.9]|uniref:Uncharacterized protein n=1 Tax=Serpula lacrymans var. lacrymans (strain S7.9) TaxID=578457 RepID=F8NXS5_SERL9|nr:uncharacterized protein SERLADRAFT_438355 [Serpula lacrymans var. lacrymans S7.9]EGO24741.1 hypothetical protein SERLADRAFT_438355 [Serpula lacrymans var. lacrymans S7.9]